jgi:hypothetical protein
MTSLEDHERQKAASREAIGHAFKRTAPERVMRPGGSVCLIAGLEPIATDLVRFLIVSMDLLEVSAPRDARD